MALSAFLERLLEHLPALITVMLMSLILIKFVWRSKQKKRDFSRKSVFITCCDNPLGFDIARRMDRLGFSVFAGFLMADGEAAMRLKGKTSSRLKTVEIDVTADEQVKKALDFVEDHLETPAESHLTSTNNLEVRRLSISGSSYVPTSNSGVNIQRLLHTESLRDINSLFCLINSANVPLSGNFQWYTSSQCQRLIDVNIMGTIRVIKYFIPLLKLERSRIVNVTGSSDKLDYPLLSVQSASKSAVNRLTNLLHQELGGIGIFVASVEHEDGMPFTVNLTEKEDINEMRLNMSAEHKDDMHMEEMYQWHRAQDAKAKRSLKAEAELLKLELELIEHAVTSDTPSMSYSTVPYSRKFLALLLELFPKDIKTHIIKILHK